MRKLLALFLTLSMVITNIATVYASNPKDMALQRLFKTTQETINQITTEAFGNNYSENYKNTYMELLKQLKAGGSFEFKVSDFYEVEGSTIPPNEYTFSYNDDGISIQINVLVNAQFGPDVEFSNLNIYIDNEKIVLNIDDREDKKLVYNFGDSLDGTTLEGLDLEFLKYKNIKTYINLLADLQTSGKIDEIVADYMANLLEYIGKADIHMVDNQVTLVIDDDLFVDYLYQLANKIENDKELKLLFNSQGLDTYFTAISGTIAYEIEFFADNIHSDFEFKYTGVIEDGVFVKNVFNIVENGDKYNATVIFNDVEQGILNDTEIYYDDDFSFYTCLLNLDNNNGERTLKYLLSLYNLEIVRGNYTYEIKDLNALASGETYLEADPEFYETSEPNPNPQSYNDWYEETMNISANEMFRLTEALKYVDSQIAKLEKAEANPSSEPVYLDLTYVYLEDFYSYLSFEYVGDYAVGELIDYDTDRILRISDTINLLDDWRMSLLIKIEKAQAETDYFVNNAKAEYDAYLVEYDRIYKQSVETYNKYLEAVENGFKSDGEKIVTDAKFNLSKNKLTGQLTNQHYDENKLYLTRKYEFKLEQSKVKNQADTKDAKDFVENADDLVFTYY